MQLKNQLYFIRFLIALFICFKINAIHAQSFLSDSTKNQLPKWILKSSPSAMLDITGYTIPFYLEQNLGYKKAIEYEAGYIFNGGLGFQKNSKGFRLRTAYRFYFEPIDWSKINVYASVALQYRYIVDNRNDFVWLQNKSFQKKLPYQLEIQMASLTGNLGIQLTLDNEQRWFFDASMGVGGRFTHGIVKNLPSDAQSPFLPFIYQLGKYYERSNEYNILMYSGVLALKIGYAIR